MRMADCSSLTQSAHLTPDESEQIAAVFGNLAALFADASELLVGHYQDVDFGQHLEAKTDNLREQLADLTIKINAVKTRLG